MPDNDNNIRTQRFMKLLVAHQRNIQAFILYLVPNRSDADDILQETLAEMWNKFDDFQPGTSFPAWSITIAKYKVLTFQRQNRKKGLCFSPETMELLQQGCDELNCNDRLSSQIDILKLCLQKLTSKEKKFLKLRYEQNLTFKGVADRFGFSIQAAYKAISGIHARLLLCVRSTMRKEELL